MAIERAIYLLTEVCEAAFPFEQAVVSSNGQGKVMGPADARAALRGTRPLKEGNGRARPASLITKIR